MRHALVALLVLSMAACAPPDTGPAKLDNYLTRLGRAVDAPQAPGAVEPPFIAPPRLSDAHLKAIEIPPSRIGVLEFLSLSGCELQVNLGRRNSSLGRHASASQRLLLDLEFLELAPDCIQYLVDNGEPQLAKDIQAIANARQVLLPAMIYNAVLGGPEFQEFWHLPPSLQDYPANTAGDVLDALHWLEQSTQRWLVGDFREDPEAPPPPTSDNRPTNAGLRTARSGALERRLAQLRAGDGGTLMLAAALQARALAQGSALLRQRAEHRPLCPGGNDTDASKVTQTVTVKFFAGDVQAWLAGLNQRHNALLTPIQALESLLASVLPEDYRHWRDRRDTLLAELQSAPKQHVNAIKAALNDCPSVPWQ